MIKAAGIDLGGSKIEAQIFDSEWKTLERNRSETPEDYAGLVAAMAKQIAWIDAKADKEVPIGISAAGLVNRDTGLAFTANLPATGRPFPADIMTAARRKVTYVNDCRAMTLSEALFGAGQGKRIVAGLIIGTGIGGGVAIDGKLLPAAFGIGGEFGHTSASAAIVARYGLPLHVCGCKHEGCIETYIAGPGLSRLAKTITGAAVEPMQIASRRHDDKELAKVWEIWCLFVAQLLKMIALNVDPDIIVLGGGLSKIEGLTEDLSAALSDCQLEGFGIPRLAVAQGGDATGARGAALCAVEEQGATSDG